MAAAGIGEIGIVDNDHIEKSNIQRQIIHETNSIGDLKIDSARERIKNLSQFMEFYSKDGCSDKNNEIKRINAYDFNRLYKAKLHQILLIDAREMKNFLLLQ